ncbi:MAG: hypothetical protein ABDH32_07630 [Candidatus Caldarchaeales archaeon]
MDFLQIILGLMAGLSHSILGWLKNRANCIEETLDPREIAEILLTVRKDWEKIDEISRMLSGLLKELTYCKKFDFDSLEFAATLIQGLLIGLFMGLIGLSLDAASSLAAQIGALTMFRKIIKIIKHIAESKKTIFSSR